MRSRKRKIEAENEDEVLPDLSEKCLHKLIRLGHDAETILAHLTRMDPDSAYEEATNVNNKGALPIDLLKGVSGTTKEKSDLYLALLRLHYINYLPDLKEFITLDSVYSEFPSEVASPLHFNLTAACLIANLTRDFLGESNTHPQSNASPRARSKVDKKIKLMRDFTDEHIKHIKRLARKKKIPRSSALLLNVQKDAAEIAWSAGVGNCREYGLLALWLATLLLPDLHAEVMEIGKGDHVFLMLGHQSLPNPLDYQAENPLPFDCRQLGEAAVVCDAWSGRIFPASTLETNLKNYRWIYPINVLTSFNPNYHFLEPLFDFQVPGADEKKAFITQLQPFVTMQPLAEADTSDKEPDEEKEQPAIFSVATNDANFSDCLAADEAATPPINFYQMDQVNLQTPSFSGNAASFWNNQQLGAESTLPAERNKKASPQASPE